MSAAIRARLLSRKFIVCSLAVVLSFIALMADQIGETIFRDLILGTAGVYVLGNVGQKYVETKGAS